MNQKKRNLSKPIKAVSLVVLLVLALALSACGNNTVTTSPSGTSTTPKTTIEAPSTAKGSGLVPGSGTAGASQSTSSTGQGSSTALPAMTTVTGASAPDAAGGEAAGGDEPVRTYVDPTGQFSFQHAQSWGNTTKPGETIRFTGRDEFISIAITTTTLSPLEFAKADASALTAASPNFKGEAIKAYKVAGTTGAMESYTWQAGPSPVTGKMIASSARRYYIPGTGGKLAVFTYSSPTNTYDPFGADDFANSFKWLN